MLRLSAMQVFRSIGNQLHIWINKKRVKGILPLNHGGDNCQVGVRRPVPL